MDGRRHDRSPFSAALYTEKDKENRSYHIDMLGFDCGFFCPRVKAWWNSSDEGIRKACGKKRTSCSGNRIFYPDRKRTAK